MNRDERRGRDANLAGLPYSTTENIDWQRGWSIVQDDRRLDDEEAEDRRRANPLEPDFRRL